MLSYGSVRTPTTRACAWMRYEREIERAKTRRLTVGRAQTLAGVADKIKNFAIIYLVDINEVRAREERARRARRARARDAATDGWPSRTQVPDFNAMYELYDPCTVMFFFRNKHIQIDLGTGNNNKVNWAMDDKQEFIDIVEVVYTGARKGRGLVVSPRDYSTKYRY